MEDSTTSSDCRWGERELYVLDFLLDLLLLLTLDWVFVDFFFTFTVLVGVAKARLGARVNARVIATLSNI